MTLRTRQILDTPRDAIELLSDKVGWVLFMLGLMHFFNLFQFNRFRRRALDRLSGTPPVPPSGFFKRRDETA
jgi:hypothetical protein